MESFIDPEVSRTKFCKELTLYKNLEREYCARGWFLAKAEFPEVFVVFASPKINPSPLVLGVLLDFTNYDFWPPSVLLVNPFTRVPYKYNELPSKLQQHRIVEKPEGRSAELQDLMQPPYTS